MTVGTPQEQLMLELINRARMDPLAEAARQGIGLNDGLPAGTISSAPKAVLAMSAALLTASDNHSDWMLTNDRFSHEEPAIYPTGRTGESPGDRMTAASYVFSGNWTWGENISWTGSTGSINLTSAIASQHGGLFRSAGHRTNILSEDFQEIGVGQQYGQYTYEGVTYNASMVTQNYALSGSKLFITGVVYDDTIDNDFYDVGEQVTSRTVSGAGSIDTTGAGGGYALQFASGGTRSIAFDLISGAVSVTVALGSENAKVDLVSGNQVWSNTTITGVSANVTALNALGIEAISLTGGLGNQTITGNVAANIIRGGGGTDTLRGLAGNDTYYVDSVDDLVIEATGQGTDTVATSVSYGLAAGTSVEVLRTTSNGGAAAINLTGNAFDQTLVGNAGANILRGGGGADILQGLGGNDTYYVDSASDAVVDAIGGGNDIVATSTSYTLSTGAEIELLRTTSNSAATAINLTGNGFAQTVMGNNGNNVINGGGGSDVLTGLGGRDSFIFNSALGASNIDRITDFNPTLDTIRLENAIFTALVTTGVLAGDAFKDIANGAKDSTDRIIYNSANGELYYDADGSGLAFSDVRFATLTSAPILSADDFWIV